MQQKQSDINVLKKLNLEWTKLQRKLRPAITSMNYRLSVTVINIKKMMIQIITPLRSDILTTILCFASMIMKILNFP